MQYSKEEQHIVIGIHRIKAKMDHATQEICSKYGITLGQFAVLEVLYHKGALCIGEVKERILSSDGTIPVIVKNLEKSGYIVRFQDEKDKRKWILDLTEAGRTLIAQVYPENEQKLQEILSVWSREEQKQLSDLLIKQKV